MSFCYLNYSGCGTNLLGSPGKNNIMFIYTKADYTYASHFGSFLNCQKIKKKMYKYFHLIWGSLGSLAYFKVIVPRNNRSNKNSCHIIYHTHWYKFFVGTKN